MYFMLACHFFFFLPNYHFPFFFLLLHSGHFFLCSPFASLPSLKANNLTANRYVI